MVAPASPTATAGPTAPPAPAWLHRPWLDLLVGCGAWTVPLLAVGLLFREDQRLALLTAFNVGMLLCNQPHYAATWHRAYLAADAARYRRLAAVLLVVAIAALLLVHRFPQWLPWLFTLYLVWSPWHYTGQNFGLALMFLRRGGSPPDRLARAALSLCFTASFIAWLAPVQAQAPTNPYFLVLSLPLPLAKAITGVAAAVMLAAAAVAMNRFVRAIGWRRAAPALVLLSTQSLWFLFPAMFLFVPALDGGDSVFATLYATSMLAVMHCAQYLWITSYYTRREAAVASTTGTSAAPWSFWRYYGALILIGIGLFSAVPWLASRMAGYELATSTFIVIALVNLHHFVLDGALWRLRDGRIATLLLGRPADPSAPTTIPAPATPTAPFARLPRWALAVAAIALVAVAIADQCQSFLTAQDTTDERLALAESIDPFDARIYRNRALRLQASGHGVEALRPASQALILNARNIASNVLLANLQLSLGNAERAVDNFQQAEADGQLGRDNLIRYGTALALAGRQEDALTAFQRARRLDPERTDTEFYLGEAQLQLRRYGEAETHLRRFLDYRGELPQGLRLRALVRYGDALAALGRKDEARAAYGDAQKQAGGDRQLLEQIAEAVKKLDR